MADTVHSRRGGRAISLVTGGSSGLGRAIAERLVARRDGAICILSRQSDRLRDVTESLKQTGCEVVAAAADVTKPDELRVAARHLEEQGYTVSTIFNVAGVPHFGPIDDATEDDVSRVIGTNLIGPINVVREFMPHLRASSGQIVNVVSRCALRGMKNEAVYSAAKWGLRGFSEALREEFKGTGLRVLTVYTGGMKTPFWTGWDQHSSPGERPSFMEPGDVADQVIAATFAGPTCDVTELVISRRA